MSEPRFQFVDPEGLSFVEWTYRMQSVNDDGFDVGIPEGEEGWKDWATSYLDSTFAKRRAILYPDSFSDWKEWARQLQGLLT